MPAKTETLKIDKEFESLCPKLSDDELKQLTANIQEAGHVRDSICTWQDKIIDGHHRYKIAKRLKVMFPIHPMQFASREDAIDWIIDNQLGRRNLDATARRLLIGKKYNRIKQAQGGDRKSKAHSDTLIGDAATYIAHDNDVGRETVKRAGKEAESFDKLASGLQSKYKAGELTKNVDQLHRLASMSKLDQVAAAKEVEAGKSWNSVLPPPEKKPPRKVKAEKPRPQQHRERLQAFIKSLGSWQAKVDEYCDEMEMTAKEKKPWQSWCKELSALAVRLPKEWKL